MNSMFLQHVLHAQLVDLRKETDILDVWFDSGISHYAVLKQNPALQYPADMYLEGKDQHRGWFQSSLLTSMIIEETPCMKTIVTHGFTVDATRSKNVQIFGECCFTRRNDRASWYRWFAFVGSEH